MTIVTMFFNLMLYPTLLFLAVYANLNFQTRLDKESI
jgi:hypothetical protein